MVVIRGKTYPYRQTIKGLGFRWNGQNKTWSAKTASADVLEALEQIPGLIITIDGDDTHQTGEIDTRTYKQKYGQCEDAPCCGCCGTHPYYG